MGGTRKNVALRTPAIASFLCLGLMLGWGPFPWAQVSACVLAAESKLEAPWSGAADSAFNGNEADCHHYGLRRLAEPDQITASLADTQPHEKSLADLGQWRDLLGVFIIGIACVAAVSAGTGGGSIYVPVMTLVMGFSPHASTVMSQSLMCGGVLAGTLLNLCQRHPFADRPLVDLDLVIFLAPAQMAGVSLGMVVNHCLPPWLLVSALVIVLSIAVVQTTKQYRRIKREKQLALKTGDTGSSASGLDPLEGAAIELVNSDAPDLSLETHIGVCTTTTPSPQRAASPPDLLSSAAAGLELKERDVAASCAQQQQRPSTSSKDNSFREGLMSPELACDGYVSESDVEAAGSSRMVLDFPLGLRQPEILQLGSADQPEEQLEDLGSPRRRTTKIGLSRLRRAREKLKEMQHRHDILKWFLVVAIWLVDISLGIIRGEKGSHVQLVPYCGWGYWFLYASSAIALIGCSYFQGISLYRLQRGKDEAAIRQVPGDLHYDLATVHLFFGQTILAGIVAGTVGIGSSLVMGPIMLMKGMLPVVCTAVNTALVLCSSSSAAVKSALGTTTPWDYCLFLFGVCFFCAMIGKFIVDRMARKYDADHVVVLFLIIIMFGSMTGMVAAILPTTEVDDAGSRRDPVQYQQTLSLWFCEVHGLLSDWSVDAACGLASGNVLPPRAQHEVGDPQQAKAIAVEAAAGRYASFPADLFSEISWEEIQLVAPVRFFGLP
ncbi:hypothetical protein Emag_001898 [Eimeria magna]